MNTLKISPHLVHSILPTIFILRLTSIDTICALRMAGVVRNSTAPHTDSHYAAHWAAYRRCYLSPIGRRRGQRISKGFISSEWEMNETFRGNAGTCSLYQHTSTYTLKLSMYLDGRSTLGVIMVRSENEPSQYSFSHDLYRVRNVCMLRHML